MKRLSQSISIILCVCALSGPGVCHQAPAASSKPADYSKEAFIFEHLSNQVTFHEDGASIRETDAWIRVESDAGVQNAGLLVFAYQSSADQLKIVQVSVQKPSGEVIETPPDTAQDLPSQVTLAAPMYSDLREKHIAVKGLGVGDLLHYHIQYQSVHPLIAGQFWMAADFDRASIVLDEKMRISVPSSKTVNLVCTTIQPKVTEQAGQRVYAWETNNLKVEEAKPDGAKKAKPADIMLSTFKSWAEVGAWWLDLEHERQNPTPAVRAKAMELIQGRTTQAQKISAIYGFVSTQIRYISISFGIGRYQPHSAEEVLGNGYGDCKDKHTLLASLLQAIGIEAYPALMNTSSQIQTAVPSPGQFDHVISVVKTDSGLEWLDSTPGAGPEGYLLPLLRGHKSLVMFSGKRADLLQTPAQPPFKMFDNFVVSGALDSNGVFTGKVAIRCEMKRRLRCERRSWLRRKPSGMTLSSRFHTCQDSAAKSATSR